MSHARTAPLKVASLYDQDVYAWSLEQVRLLRAGDFAAIDAENIAEEILDVGKTEYRILQSALLVLLMHMLKWDHQPDVGRARGSTPSSSSAPGWCGSFATAPV
jgi:hypothetical protein